MDSNHMWRISECSSTNSAGFLLKLGIADTNTEAPKWRPPWKGQENLYRLWSRTEPLSLGCELPRDRDYVTLFWTHPQGKPKAWQRQHPPRVCECRLRSIRCWALSLGLRALYPMSPTGQCWCPPSPRP